MKGKRPIAFRWVFPIAELLLSALLLRPWSSFFFLQARSAAHALSDHCLMTVDLTPTSAREAGA
jgi:hypothetical protein